MTTTIRMTGPLEPRGDWTADNCPMAKALDVVRTRAAFLILREAFYGATRFDEFAERTGLSEPIASARLRELVDAEILRREPYQEPGQRTRQRYRLTDKGADLLPILVGLMEWGDKWLGADSDRRRVELRHRECGARVSAELRCAHGHAVDRDQIDLARVRRPRAAA
jgi:DNA-binding HxlR family transcriptional regulator